jgi:hypothetical protein
VCTCTGHGRIKKKGFHSNRGSEKEGLCRSEKEGLCRSEKEGLCRGFCPLAASLRAPELLLCGRG